jgi:hypothetical protein
MTFKPLKMSALALIIGVHGLLALGWLSILFREDEPSHVLFADAFSILMCFVGTIVLVAIPLVAIAMKRPEILSITITAILLLIFGSLGAWSAWLSTLPSSGAIAYVGEPGWVEDYWGYWGTGATVGRKGSLLLFAHSLIYPGSEPSPPGSILYYPSLGSAKRTKWPKGVQGRWAVLPLRPVVAVLAIVSGLLALRLFILIRRLYRNPKGFAVIANDLASLGTQREWSEATRRLRRLSRA